MVKKVLTFALGLMLTLGAMAQTTGLENHNPVPQIHNVAPISQNNVRYWVGQGSNRVVVLITWFEEDANEIITKYGFVWGVRFNGTVTAADIMDTLNTYESRINISFSGSHSFINDMTYDDGNMDIEGLGYGWMYEVNGAMASAINAQSVSNNDFIEWFEWDGSSFSAPTSIDVLTYVEDPNAPATPDEATIAASDIVYWVGEGSNQVVMAVNWADTALAWGYRFDGTKTVNDMMTDIAAADPRFSYTMDGYYLNDINFNAGSRTLAITPGNYWSSTNNGFMDMGMNQPLANGDFEKWADPTAGVIVDSTYDETYHYWWYTYVYPMTIYPVSVPAPADATIDASEIEYWVGEGSNQVVMAVNWADTALAWGYRFNGTKTVNDMMNDIATADPRFSYTMDGYYLNDINFNDGSRILTITPGNYWSSSNNGIMDAGMSQTLVNGDFEKWADPAAGIIVDSTYDETYHYWWYTYAYPMAINAVSQPAAMGPFCGVVGTTGCTAIAYNDNRIKAWATGCTLVLGSQNLSDPSAPVVTYGTADEAVGAASTSTMDVVSLGDGGSATLTFEKPIANGDGYDFAVFENSFNDYFLELAFVEVSSDGERFVRFPATSLTQTARQITSSVDPTYINNLAGKYRVGYGTPFDLNELRDSAGLDINNITHVRVIDVVGSIDPELGTYDAFGHIINDPFPTITYSAGFDLDGIAVLNQKTERIELAENGVQMSVYPNPATDRICVTLENLENIDATLFDMSGRAVKTLTLRNGDNTIDISTLQNGIYLIRVAGSVTKIVKK
jgi:hypothetical protein